MTERLLGIKGPMFSEKTTALIGRVHRAEHAGKKVQVFKPLIDIRWGSTDRVKSHNGVEYPATAVKMASEILDNLEGSTNFVAIDEIQFFDPNIVEVVRNLLEQNIEVVFDGLPLDFRGEPFGKMPELLALSDRVVDMTAVCKFKKEDGSQCNQEATRTQRKVDGKPANYHDPIVLIGAEESYEARCPSHHEVPGKPQK